MDALRVAVLGCGPAGLLAAHGIAQAADDVGKRPVEIKIFSSKRKSPLYGCQYLHRSIPGLVLPARRVSYRLTGSITGYRKKVYGENEDVLTSVEELEADHYAWDIRKAYDELWEMYEPAIEDYYLSPGSFSLLQPQLRRGGFHLILSTIPAPAMCKDEGCTFTSEQVWAMGDAPSLERFAQVPVQLPDNTILCNGKPEMPWYRVSRVFGHHTVEWPVDATPIPRGASRVTKPIRTTCECNPSVIRSGRYATWKKGVLAHTSFEDGYRLARRALA